MPDLVFVDTNVLVYARDAARPEKQRQAAAWMRSLWERRAGRLSFQVLQEFYAAVTMKLRPGMKPADARRDVRALLAWKPLAVGAAQLEGAWAVQERFGLSWWDALIVSTAQSAGCRFLLSEDLQDGQELAGLRVLSPFSHPAPP